MYVCIIFMFPFGSVIPGAPNTLRKSTKVTEITASVVQFCLYGERLKITTTCSLVVLDIHIVQ